MKHILRKYQTATIKEQIRWAIIVVSVLSILVLGSTSYLFTKNLMKRNYIEDFTSNLRIADHVMTIQLKSVLDSTRNLLINKDFMEALESANESEGKYFSTNSMQKLAASLGGSMEKELLIGEIVAIDNTGKIYSYSLSTRENTDYRFGYENILESDFILQAQKDKGKEFFYGRNVLKEENQRTVSMVKQVIDPATGVSRGYLVVNIRKKLFESAFGTGGNRYETNGYMIVAPEDQYYITFFQGDEATKQNIQEQYVAEGTPGREYVYAYRTNNISNWELVSFVRQEDLLKDSSMIGVMIVVLLIVLILAGVPASRLVSQKIYEPLHKLEETIEQMGGGNRNITEQFDESEIGVIGNRFKYIVNNNLELRERLLSGEVREREAELLLLQSQINPHFLYNTLDSLYCMAIIQKADDVANMVEALSKTFRMSLHRGNRLILVEHEIEHIQAYMEVQMYRYKKRFQLKLDIEDSLKGQYMLKFILQPFVENAMYHGLEPKLGEGFIQVIGKEVEDAILFIIEDDGVGMECTKQLQTGYGVTNVMERIRLYYGANYGISVESEAGKGTRIKIKIAKVSKEEGILGANNRDSG